MQNHIHVHVHVCKVHLHVHVNVYTETMYNVHVGSHLPLCLPAISPARAWSLPPAGWATAVTNSCQEGSPKHVVSYSLFSHSDRALSRQRSTSVVLASILLRRSGCSLSALPTLLQLCATLSSSEWTSKRSLMPAERNKIMPHSITY